MRIFVALIALCFASYALSAQGTCAKDSLCQGCTDGATTCTSCYNYAGKINPKQFATNACGTDVANTVADCKYYKNTISATKSNTDCTQCNSKTWLNITDNSSAASIVIACSATAVDTTNCAAAVSNCTQSYCYKAAGSSTGVKGCALCASGYVGDGTPTAVGYPTCTQTGAISNCAYANRTDKTKCAVCSTGYAVAIANDTSCTAFTTDANCRKLGGSTTPWCIECKDGYYFDGKGVCLMSSWMMRASALLVALLMFFN